MKREGKRGKEEEEGNQLPGSHCSAVTCQWQLTIAGPPGRMSKRASRISWADGEVARSDSLPRGRRGVPGGGSALPAGGSADEGG